MEKPLFSWEKKEEDETPKTEYQQFLCFCENNLYVPCSVTLDYWKHWKNGFKDMDEKSFSLLIDLFACINNSRKIDSGTMRLILEYKHGIKEGVRDTKMKEKEDVRIVYKWGGEDNDNEGNKPKK